MLLLVPFVGCSGWSRASGGVAGGIGDGGCVVDGPSGVGGCGLGGGRVVEVGHGPGGRKLKGGWAVSVWPPVLHLLEVKMQICILGVVFFISGRRRFISFHLNLLLEVGFGALEMYNLVIFVSTSSILDALRWLLCWIDVGPMAIGLAPNNITGLLKKQFEDER